MIMGNSKLLAQNDSLTMNTDEILVGEIKILDKGIITIETDYGDSDFKIEWDKVKYINTIQKFIIITTNGNRYYGKLISHKGKPSNVVIVGINGQNTSLNIRDISFLRMIDDTFWSRIDLLMSVGYTLAKANNSHQFSSSIKTGYLSSKFKADVSFSAIRTVQTVEDVEARISRTEGGLGILFFVINDWFAVARSDLLQSSEQMLNIRSTTKGGIGNYILKTDQMELGFAGGAAWNVEDYEDNDSSDRNSVEIFAAMEYNIFDLGDLDLMITGVAYPSLTERKRFRSDFSFDIKYEFPRDFFINLGFTLNYDNQPVTGASKGDYVLQTTIGWEL